MSASPELFLRRAGDEVESGPIKGTAPTAAGLTDKDRAENVMIVDLVRNDLGAVAVTGSVEVPALNAVEEHPGLVHLVSTVRARLRPGAGWADLLAATFPPGSVTGAPEVQRADRDPRPRARCRAARTAGRSAGSTPTAAVRPWPSASAPSGPPADRLHLGTGAGITWGSDAAREWDETELKARRLLAVAAREEEHDEGVGRRRGRRGRRRPGSRCSTTG